MSSPAIANIGHSSTAIAPVSTNTGIPTHSQMHHLNPLSHQNKVFSPMAALSRSPSCSSSPAVSGSHINSNVNRRSLMYLQAPAHSSHTAVHMNPCMSPYTTEPNFTQCKTPMSFVAHTPSFNNPINNRGSYTPQTICTDLSMIEFNEQPISECVLEFFWSEQIRLNKAVLKNFEVLVLFDLFLIQANLCAMKRQQNASMRPTCTIKSIFVT
jgi:hypothetical protein